MGKMVDEAVSMEAPENFRPYAIRGSDPVPYHGKDDPEILRIG